MSHHDQVVLSEVLDRVLNKGAVLTGEVVISVAGIDLLYLGLPLFERDGKRATLTGTARLPASLRRPGAGTSRRHDGARPHTDDIREDAGWDGAGGQDQQAIGRWAGS